VDSLLSNDIIDCLTNHKSVRSFKNEMIPKEVVETILNAGARAATGGNLQCYSFIIIDDPDLRKRLTNYDIYNDLSNVPLIIIALVDTFRLKRWFEVNNAEHPYLSEPSGLFLSYWDAIIALHNVSIAAESLGLGTYYDGNVLEFDIQELFDAPKYTFPAGMLCIGYPSDIPNLSVRLPLEAVVHRNKYRRLSDNEIKEYYSIREKIWESVSDRKKEELSTQNIHNIPQALAKQKFSKEFTVSRSRRICNMLKKSGFNIKEYLD